MTRDLRRSTNRYAKRRLAFLARHPLCAECERRGRITGAVELDHIVPVEAGGAFWDEANWQGLCRDCHEAKTEGERRAGKFAQAKSVPGRDKWRDRVGLSKREA